MQILFKLIQKNQLINFSYIVLEFEQDEIFKYLIFKKDAFSTSIEVHEKKYKVNNDLSYLFDRLLPLISMKKKLNYNFQLHFTNAKLDKLHLIFSRYLEINGYSQINGR